MSGQPSIIVGGAAHIPYRLLDLVKIGLGDIIKIITEVYLIHLGLKDLRLSIEIVSSTGSIEIHFLSRFRIICNSLKT